MASDDIVLQLADQFAKLDSAMQAARRTLQLAAADVDPGLRRPVQDADSSMGKWFKTIAEGVAVGNVLSDTFELIVRGIKDAAAALPELALHGAIVDDVAENFSKLAAQAGHAGSVMLDTLRQGTHATIDDFTLMQRANKDLAAGLNLTDTEMATLSKGAFALAQATGGSVKDALDSMSDALVTGRAKAVALLTGKVDLALAEEKYAEKLGLAAKELTAEQKLEADRAAILLKVGDAVKRLGEQTDGLDERVDQAKAAWANFVNELGRAVATSPTILAAFDGIRDALNGAFGGDRESMIKGVASAIDQAAIFSVNLGLAAVEAARVIHVAWSAINVVVLGVETAIVGVVDAIGEALLAAEKLASKLHLVDPAEVQRIQDTVTYLRGMTASLAEDTAEAARGVVGMSKFDETLDRLGGTLFQIKDRMEAAAGATTDFVGPIDQATVALQRDVDALEAARRSAQAWSDHMKQLAAQQKKEVDEWLDGLDKQHDANADWYDDAIAAMQGWRDLHQSIDGATMSLGGWMDDEIDTISMLDALGRSVDDTSVKVRTLSGELISVKEAMDRWTMGNSITYDLSTDAGIANYKQLNPSASISWSDAQIEAFIRTGGTLAQLINQGVINPYAGYSTFPTHDYVGPARGGQPYWIGAGAQPELFVPQTDGMMFPRGAAGGGLKVDVHFHGGVIDPATAQHMATQLGAAILGNTGMPLVGV